jgi:uncharacterized protein YhbP (UPF0306 family)
MAEKKINFKFNNPTYKDEELNESINKILSGNQLGAFATINNNASYINTAYYCFNSKMSLYFISDPSTQHVQNIKTNSSIAIAISNSDQSWDNAKCGLQLFGKCEQAKGLTLIEGTALYLKRFVGIKQWITNADDFIKGAINSKMYVVKISKIKLFDEETFGEEVYIDLENFKV